MHLGLNPATQRALRYFVCALLAGSMLAASLFVLLEICLDLVQILAPLQYGQLGFVTKNLHSSEGALFWRVLAGAIFFAVGSTAWFVRPRRAAVLRSPEQITIPVMPPR